ncbi:hypothetical protein BGZ97_005363 [Linnemannia gamsii]|uniref:C2H2-type domain-containing protein n=1 Tax=Linnemannia gamsii TaxID=64522 RepID=A0A9P6QT25_9FUNG|nr:hypothetical protein BGZ97_005363 [Linnemannia gamsii]
MADHIRHTPRPGGTKETTSPKITHLVKFTCTICQKAYKNEATLRSHLFDCHDNGAKRIQPLKCIQSSCASSFQSRQKFLKHIGTCTGDSSSPPTPATGTTLIASTTKEQRNDEDEDRDDEVEVQDTADIVAEAWVDIQGEEEVDQDDQDQIGKKFDRLQEQLISTTGNRNTAEFLLSLMEPVAINLKSGETENVLALPGGTKRLLRDVVVSIQPVKRRAPKGNDIQDGELRPALAAHAFGGLVDDESSYMPLDDDLCYRSFRNHGSDIAKRLAGALLQSGPTVLLALKVEVYGRSPSEDPHQQDVAYPVSGPFIVRSLLHDGATKILIGTQTWNALVTSAVTLTRGAVVVGPNNTVFHPHPRSKVWILKDSRQNLTIERQTRSKFDDPISLEPNAGVFVRFLAHKFLPVTLKTLWDYFMGKKWSGIKLIAFIFHQLYHTRRLDKIDIESKLQEVVSIKNRTQSDSKILGDVRELVLAFEERDHVSFPVNWKVSNCLRILAGYTTNAITILNQDVVAREIEKHIRIVCVTEGLDK